MFQKATFQSVIRNIVCWAFASLLAIVIVQFNALAGLAIAVVAGIILGIFLFVK